MVTSFHIPLFALMSGLMFKRVLGWAKATSRLASQSLKLLLTFATVGLLYTYLALGYGGRIYPKWSEDGILVSVLSMVVLSHHPIYNNIGSGRFRKKGWARYSIDILWMLQMMIIPRIIGSCSVYAVSLLAFLLLGNKEM